MPTRILLSFILACAMQHEAAAGFAAPAGIAGAVLVEPDRDPAEQAKIEGLIEAVRGLEDAVFIRNGREHSAADAAAHMESKLDYAGDRIETAEQFIEHIASKSSISGRPYLIRFGGASGDERDVKSGDFLREQLREIEASMRAGEAGEGDEQDQARARRQALRHFEPLMGEWTGTLTVAAPPIETVPIPIRWTTMRAFDGRWIRFEFTSIDEVSPGRWVEWEGLFTAKAGTGEIESIWLSTRLRQVAGESRFLDGRTIFFEKGGWDDTGRILTLIAHKQYENADQPVIEVKSTFTIAEDGQSFKVVDEEKQEDGTWKTSGVFELERARR